MALDWPILDAVEESLVLLEREPRAGHALRGRLTGLRSLRVGSFRVIYAVTYEDRAVRVVAVRHRQSAYETDPR